METLEGRHLLAVVISEFMASNDTTLQDDFGDTSDWIELHNDAPTPVNLDGYYLTDNADNLTKWQFPSVTMSADSYLIVYASDRDRTEAGQPLHTNFKLSADGEYLALVQPDGQTVVSAFAPSFPEQVNDVSYGRSPSSDLVGYFMQPSPGAMNSEPIPDSAGAVVISEIMYSLPRSSILEAENTSLEFIELYNRGVGSIDVTGWQFTRGIDFTLPAVSIPGGQRLVVAADVDAFSAQYPTVTAVVGGWTGKLSNNGETLELVDSTGALVDRVRYASEGEWSQRVRGTEDNGFTGWEWSDDHDGGGKSLELVNALMSNDLGRNWMASQIDGGTPGSANSVASDNAPVVITDVMHTPAIPHSDETVTITAHLTDESLTGLAATLFWRVNATGDFQSVEMRDDGQQGDAVSGDQTFSARLPSQPDRTVIEFYVSARDQIGQERTWPAPTVEGQQATNGLYQVLDDFEPLEPGMPPIYHEIMTPADRAEFDSAQPNSPERLSNAQFHATFIAVTGTGVSVRYNTGVRYRGSASRNDRITNNRITIPDDAPWEGITRINVNARNPVNQISGSALFRLAGVPAADVHAVRLFGNGVDLKQGGYYVHSEALDSEYAENHFASDSEGNLYRGRRPNESPPGGQGAGLVYFGEDPAPYVSYVKSTNSSEADWSDVIELTRVLNTTSEDAYVTSVEQVADVSQWFRAFAMNALIDNNEYGLFTGDPLGDDFAMYRGVEDSRFQMVPYDWDTLYGNVGRSILRPTGVPALAKLIDHPHFEPEYYRQFLDLIENVVLTDAAETVLTESLRHVTTANEIARIHQFLVDRANFVRNQINQVLTVASPLAPPGNLPVSNTSEFVLSGDYPRHVTRSLRIDGELVPLDGSGSWQYASSADPLEPLLSMGSIWRYLDDGSDQGSAWRNADFDDSAWDAGPAQLGYGDGDEATVVDFGGDANNRHVTTYFRTRFELEDPSDVLALSMSLLYDDGVAVYLNGTEILREDLPVNAAYDTLASVLKGQDEENVVTTYSLTPDALNALVPGTNVLAVEVHQGGADSPDIGLDLGLYAIVRNDSARGLKRGMNRLLVEAFTAADGTGTPVASQTFDLAFDDGSFTNITEDLSGANVWRPEEGPYVISGNVTIPTNAGLEIEAGTTIFFRQGARLTVAGQLRALGSESDPIWFTRLPGTNSWNGIQFEGSTADNLLDHVILEYGITDDGMIGLEDSKLTLSNAWLDHTDRRRIRTIDSSLVVTDSTFANIFDFGEAPTTDNRSEHIWGRGIPAEGEWVISGNTFGTITGHNDAIDFDAPRNEGRFAIIRGNHFQGGGDDALDMTGDVFIEGNLFQNYIKDQFNTDPGESNTISASGGEFWTIRNVFDNVQHASLVKEDAFMHFLQNTVHESEFTPLYFDLPGQTSGPGRGANVVGSLFAKTPSAFAQVLPTTDLTIASSFLPAVDADSYPGPGNLYGDPHVGGASTDFALLPGSRAAGAGPNGADMGARIPAGATLDGVPTSVTNGTSASITVGGPGIAFYQYRLDGGEISSPRPVATPLALTGLAAGGHQLEVWGIYELGFPTQEPTLASWTVTPSLTTTIRINEILADNVSAYAQQNAYWDAVELYNFGTNVVDLGGYRLSDRETATGGLVVAAGTQLGPGQYLVLTHNTAANPPVNNLPFGIDRDGDALYLYSPSGTLLDSINFGHQLTDRSIGRVGHDGDWILTEPTLGAPNQSIPVDNADGVVINEWYANGSIRLEDDQIELFNPGTKVVDLGGYSITDEPFAFPRRHEFPPLHFIDANGFHVLLADGNPEDGPQHLDFGLNATHEHLAIMNPTGEIVEQVFYYSQTSEFSQGRVPDGSNDYTFRAMPTFGATNGEGTGDLITILDFDWNDEWRFNNSGDDLGAVWRDPGFDDSGWSEGPGLLGRENEPLPEPLRTQFEIGPITYYFRKTVNVSEEALDTIAASFFTIVDDGFIVYVNGQEVRRQGMPAGDIDYQTLADRNVNEAEREGPFAIPASVWRAGENVIAVEVHQTRTNSSDLVFGMNLTATMEKPNQPETTRRKVFNALRITEVMYHPQADGGEYIELQNTGDESIDLSGVRIDGGVRFTFPEGLSLPAGAFVVIAEDVSAFRAAYGVVNNLVGEYEGRLDNAGEEVALLLAEPLETAVLRFEYAPEWFAETDGMGSSLVIRDPATDFRRWSDFVSWNAAPPSPGKSTGEGLPADLNGDQVVDAADIDFLCMAVRSGDLALDLTGDNQVDLADLRYLVEDLMGTTQGDANLDGIFNSSDLVAIFVVGEYEDAIPGNSTWAEGDWNCDGDFTSSDFVVALQAGGYVLNSVPRQTAATAATTDWSLAAAAVDSYFERDSRKGFQDKQ